MTDELMITLEKTDGGPVTIAVADIMRITRSISVPTTYVMYKGPEDHVNQAVRVNVTETPVEVARAISAAKAARRQREGR